MALYRRYRPQTFQEVIGQEHVTRPIMAALRADRTAHAYLFSGPRGCGKTTSARILARCLNCVQAPTDTPCGECESCRELSLGGGGSLDVVEMDAASHGGVDDARELIERAAFAPARDRYKIFIIDEAHMVSNQGFNALLKLVEEPPPHVKFVFATTEPEKVIGTIRSRTHHYPFRLVPPETLENYMAGICDEEGIEIGGGVLPLVVRAGGGSVRDSLSVLDQLIGGSEGDALEYDHAIALLGYTDGSLLDDAVEAIAARDGSTLFAVVERIVQSGHDPRRFVEDLLQRLRDLVVIALAGEDAGDVLVSVPRDQYERMVTQAEHLGASGASRSADLTNEALSGMVGATSPRLQLELLCARLLLPKPAESEDQLARGRFDAGAGRRADAPGRLGSGGHSGADGRSDGAGRAGTRSSAESDNDTATAVRPAGPPARPASAQRKPPSRGGAGRPAGRQISPAWVAGSDSSDGFDSSDGNLNDPSNGENTGAEGSGSPRNAVRAGLHDAADGDAGSAVNDVASRGTGSDGEEADVADAGGGQSASADVAIVRQRWAEVAAAVARSSKSTAALIDERNAMIAGIRDGVLGLQFRTAGLATTFNDRDHARRVAAVLHDVLGLNLRVRGLVGGDGGPKAAPARNRAGGPRGLDSDPAQAARARRATERDQLGQPEQREQRGAGSSNPGRPNPDMPNSGRPNPGTPNSGRPNPGTPNSGRPHPDMPNLGRPNPDMPREEVREGQPGWKTAESRQNATGAHEPGTEENGPATEKSADARESLPDAMAGPTGTPTGATGVPNAAREGGATRMPDLTREQNATSVPNARPSNAQTSPDVVDARWMPASDLEERGLVLASDPADIPAGPRPTRDQLASALKELESEQAARSGRPSAPDVASVGSQEQLRKYPPGGKSEELDKSASGGAGDSNGVGSTDGVDGAGGAADTVGAGVTDDAADAGGAAGAGDAASISSSAYGSGGAPGNSRNEFVAGPMRGNEAFGGLPEPVELDDEPEPYDFPPVVPDFAPDQARLRDHSEPSDHTEPSDHSELAALPAPSEPPDHTEPLNRPKLPREARRQPDLDSTPSRPRNPSAEESAMSADPAGVLAQLLDKSAVEASATTSLKGPTPPESDDIPFYEQRMPMPKRPGSSESNPAGGRDSGARTVDGNAGVPGRAQGVHTPRGVEGFRGRASSRQTPSISERIMAAHGEGRQKPRAEASAFDDSEDEVSLSDPTISHSDLVGIDVVLSTFDGTVIEEIARTDGGNGGN